MNYLARAIIIPFLYLTIFYTTKKLHANTSNSNDSVNAKEQNTLTINTSQTKKISQLTAHSFKHWGSHSDESDEPDMTRMTELQLSSHKLKIHLGGRLKDEFFNYNHVRTFRTDLHDNNDFFRHKMNLDLLVTQGVNDEGKPSSQAGIRFTNYVFWQDESNYLPITIDEIRIPELDNLKIAQDIKVKTLLPLIFVEQAWFKINFDTFSDAFKNLPAFLRVGYFPYSVGRGVALGFHEDLAVDYLGWGGEGGFSRYPVMPPGILFRAQFTEHLSWDLYFNLWRETNASLIDTLKPERASRLNTPPERGSGKDRTTWVTKIDYKRNYPDFGDVLLEPYLLYVDAPELKIELPADSSSRLVTAGIMADWHHNNWSFNMELAGQFGHQRVHAIDRNIEQLTRSSVSGAVGTSFSHIDVVTAGANEPNPARRAQAPVAQQDDPLVSSTLNTFEPDTDYHFLVNAGNNRSEGAQGQEIRLPSGTISKLQGSGAPGTNLINSEVFGNKRFRPAYKLSNQGFMALADISYECENHPLRFSGALGHISGDKYPYNDEFDQHYKGFIPMRSRYRGLGVQNFLMFDRLAIPRPLNISNRTLFAFNNIKDLSNLQFVGIGMTWYPLEERKKLSVTTDVTFLWEAATLKKWDKNGKHPDPAIEAQLVRLRNTPAGGSPTLFSGWESQENARRMLGAEFNMKVLYSLLDHCDWLTRVILFFPGGLYTDLDGQPNQTVQRVDERNLLRFDSLGDKVAFAFVTGLRYKF